MKTELYINKASMQIKKGDAEKIIGNSLYINADDFSYQTNAENLFKIDEFMGSL